MSLRTVVNPADDHRLRKMAHSLLLTILYCTHIAATHTAENNALLHRFPNHCITSHTGQYPAFCSNTTHHTLHLEITTHYRSNCVSDPHTKHTTITSTITMISPTANKTSPHTPTNPLPLVSASPHLASLNHAVASLSILLPPCSKTSP